MDIIDTFAWLRPDGRLGHTPASELPPDGDGLWLYGPRDPARAPVVIGLARACDGGVHIAVAEVGGTPTATGLLEAHRQLIAPRRPPFPARPGEDGSPVSTAMALAAAMAWADRQLPP